MARVRGVELPIRREYRDSDLWVENATHGFDTWGEPVGTLSSNSGAITIPLTRHGQLKASTDQTGGLSFQLLVA